MELRDYQVKALDRINGFFGNKEPALILSAPPGSGKTLTACEVLRRHPEGIVTAPTEEILDGFRAHGAGDDQLYTIKKLKNILGKGTIDPSAVKYIIHDECHHGSDDTHKTVDEFLGHVPRLGFTGTMYRGTPRETAKLMDWYGRNTYTILTIPDSIRLGHTMLPKFEVIPLVDDETISLTAGEFTASVVTSQTKEKLGDLVDLIVKRRAWEDKATMVALSSRDLVTRFVEMATARGVPAVGVTGDTDKSTRDKVFTDVQDRKCLLVQISVVAEGVNLPGLRRLIDARPTMSPVFWKQLTGRIERPHAVEPECWVCNHNLLRHGYLYEGAIPRAVFTEAIKAWGSKWQPSRRMVGRAVGLDGLGRFKPVMIPTKSGDPVWAFFLGHKTRQYAAIMRPEDGKPRRCASREFVLDAEGKKRYDLKPRWRILEQGLPDMTGCTSVPAEPLSEAQANWWKSRAGGYGIHPDFEPDSREFQVLPLLTDLSEERGRKLVL